MILNPVPMRVEHTPELREAFEKVFKYFPARSRPRAVIETGTYAGLGTTGVMCDVIRNSPLAKKGLLSSKSFISIEADPERVKEAKKNLERHKIFLKIKTGLSVDHEEALQFIENDELLLNHEDYPGVYYDAEDPIPFYKEEISTVPSTPQGVPLDNLLLREIPNHLSKTPLFVLDSAGGIGWLEYQVVTKLMLGRPYWIWLHDIHHVKHIRSYCHILNAKDCRIVAEKEKEWVLARFNFKKGRRRVQYLTW